MSRLWVRLGLAFALIALLAIAIVGLIANAQLSAGFHRYVATNQVEGRILPALLAYYDSQGDWQGVAAAFQHTSGQQGGNNGGRGAPRYAVADASGQVVYDEIGLQPTLSAKERRQAFPIQIEGETVGYLLVQSGAGMGQRAAEEAFLELIARSLLQAGIVAGLLALLLGLVIARQVASPLDRLAQAARALSGGDLAQRVPVAGSQEIQEVMGAFNEMAGALQQAEAERQRMIADIAHELRTPLTVLQGNLQAILDDVYPLTKSEIAQVYDQTLLLGRLVSDLRALTQVETHQLQLHPQPTDLAQIIQSTVNFFREQARSHDIDLLTNIETLPLISTDAERVQQILANLVSNALRHTPPAGAVTIHARTRRTMAQKPVVEIAVSDTGPGLSLAEQAHVFDRFWRADAARSRDQGGSGLGLAISRRLAEALGGEMGVESEVGQGARFWFTLPLA